MNYQDKLVCLKSAVEYLDDHNYFEKIKSQCDISNNYETIVHIFSINVNLHELLEKSVLLGEKVLASPVESSKVFHEVIFEYIKCQGLLPANITSSQVLAKLCITYLPCKSFQICSLSDLTKHSNYQGLVKLSGIVSGFSGATKYTQSARYVCSDSHCEGHYGNHFIRIHIPGASETQTVRSDFMCTFCGDLLEETLSSRILSDKLIAEVIPIRLEGHQRKECLRNQMTQAVPVIIRDDLVNKIEIGKSYVIIGICRTDYLDEEITITLEIKSTICSSLDIIPHLPRSIAFIYHDCKPYAWRFPLQMAFHFASSIVPSGKMIKLRLLVLISLVLSAQENKLHILTMGNETDQAFAVMKYAMQFSRRSCLASSTTPLNAKVSNTKYPWTPYFIEGGSLPSSTGGVCFFGEIGMWKKARREQLKTEWELFKEGDWKQMVKQSFTTRFVITPLRFPPDCPNKSTAVSSNKVMIELAPKYTGSLSQTISFPLSCQIWAIYGLSGTRPKAGNSNSDVFTGCYTGDLSKSFLDAFDVISFLDTNLSTYDDESDLEYLDFIWRAHCPDGPSMESTDSELKVEAIDYEKYLSMASQMETQISVEAEVLVHSYFSASRMARTSGCSGSVVPPSGLATLTSLSLGIAKLQLHSIVTESDAVLAIYIYEEYLTSRCGVSVLSIQPQPHIPNCEVDKFLGMQTDIMMQQFYMRLQQFCMRVKDSLSFTNQLKFRNSFAFKEE